MEELRQRSALDMAEPFIKLMRSRETEELMKDPKAFMLLCLIAYRAKRKDSLSIKGLSKGEALIGDFETIGLTRRQYRTSIERLVTWGFLTIKTTNKGTIAKIVKSTVFDINEEEDDQQSDHQAAIKRPLTRNKEIKNKKDKSFLSDSVEIGLSQALLNLIRQRKPDFEADVQKWAKHIDRMIRLDNRSIADIEEIIKWCQEDDFWQNNILSTQKLREQFDQLYLKSRQKKKTGSTQAGNYEEIFRGGI